MNATSPACCENDGDEDDDEGDPADMEGALMEVFYFC